jgi:HSP20 family protein
MALALWRSKRGLTRRRPLRDLATGIDDLLDRFARGWAPAVDMVDRKNEVVVRVDVPGLSEKDISVSIDNRVLTISGERKEDRETHRDDFYCSERWIGGFSRTLTLPQGVDAEGIEATLKHGILEVHLPKTKEAAEKRIEVNAA